MTELAVVHGPNLQLLGTREPEVYGHFTLAEIDAALTELARAAGFTLRTIVSNHEGDLIDALHAAHRDGVAGVLINPAGYGHTSVSLRDAIAAIDPPCVEVHLSNIAAREPFRRQTLTAAACIGSVSGFGWRSYQYGLAALLDVVQPDRD